MDELNAANLPVVAVLMVDQAKGKEADSAGRQAPEARKASLSGPAPARALRSEVQNAEADPKLRTTAGTKS